MRPHPRTPDPLAVWVCADEPEHTPTDWGRAYWILITVALLLGLTAGLLGEAFTAADPAL